LPSLALREPDQPIVRKAAHDDGNARASRMVVNLLLMSSGYPAGLYSITNRSQYLETPERAQMQGDDEGFIALTVTAVEVMLDQYLQLLPMTEDADTQFRPRPRGSLLGVGATCH
jgi:Fic family protein